MSLIGPRASTWDSLEAYQKDELDKMKVRPGISGYTQAYYRNSISMREKRINDVWYANNVSFLLDVKIVLKTIETVIFRKRWQLEHTAYWLVRDTDVADLIELPACGDTKRVCDIRFSRTCCSLQDYMVVVTDIRTSRKLCDGSDGMMDEFLLYPQGTMFI